MSIPKCMFVTGGSRGIGAGIVVEAARAGYDVAFTYRGRAAAAGEVTQRAQEANAEVVVRAYQLDVSNPDQVEDVADRVVDDFDEVGVVVNNAGITCAGLAFSTSDEDWSRVLNTNLSGAFYVSRQFLQPFLAQGGGRFIHLSSIAAGGMSGDVAYCASKAGLLGLSAGLAKEYGRKNITSNAITLSLFETEMTSAELTDDKRAFYRAHCPVGRAGEVSEVAAGVLYLASDAAGFVNGQVLGITGGLDWFH